MEFIKIVDEYIQKFEIKQGIELDFWICEKIGELACFDNLFTFDFQDIMFDIDSDQPENTIPEWQEYCLENYNGTKSFPCVNYENYCNGVRV